MRNRNKEIVGRRSRRSKLKKLKERLDNAKNESDRNHIVELIQRRSPYFVPHKKSTK